ncbi:coiled-coil domain-containing protein mad1, partial [Coemansia sp. RSA 25]
MADHRREVDELREHDLDRALDRDVDRVADAPDRTADKSDRVEDVPDRVADAHDRVADVPDRVAQLERDVAEQCAYIRAAEAQNHGLRADVRRLSTQAAQADAQREAAHALQAKVARLEAQLAARADGDAQLAQLLEERRVWAAALATSPVAAAHAADAQRRAIAGLEAQAAERQAALDDAAAQLESARQREASAAAQAAEQAARVARLEEERVGLRAQLQRAACEADFLRAQLASYDAEDARLMASYDEPKAARIRQLELFVDQQRAWLRGEARDALPDLAPLLQGARDDAEHARAELRVARERCDALERDAARLEHQLGAGLGFNPRTTRILQLRDNPAARDYAIRSERLDALAAENAALVDRMRALSSSTAEAAKDASKNDNKDASKDDSPLFCTIDNLRKDNDALATQLR